MTILKIFIYSLPMLGGGMINFLIVNYFIKYSTDILLLSPGFVGVAFFISRLWDAFSDPVCGYLSDRTKSKRGWGRRKIWILVASFPVTLFFSLIWFKIDASQMLNQVWYLVVLVALFTALTAVYVPHYSWGAELGKNDKEKNTIFGIRAIVENLGIFIAVALVSFLTSSTSAYQDSIRFMPFVGLILILFSISAFYIIKDNSEYEGHSRVGLFASWMSTLRNHNFKIIILSGFFSQLGAGVLLAVILYFAEYVLRAKQSGPAMIAAFMFAATFSIPLWIKLASRFSKKNLWRYNLWVLSVGFIITFFIPSEQKNLFLIACILLGSFSGAVLMLNPSIVADTVREDKNGVEEGVYFSIFTFANKSSIGFSAVILGFALSYAGFKPNSIQSSESVTMMKTLFSLVPAICFLLSAAIMNMYKELGETSSGKTY